MGCFNSLQTGTRIQSYGSLLGVLGILLALNFIQPMLHGSCEASQYFTVRIRKSVSGTATEQGVASVFRVLWTLSIFSYLWKDGFKVPVVTPANAVVVWVYGRFYFSHLNKLLWNFCSFIQSYRIVVFLRVGTLAGCGPRHIGCGVYAIRYTTKNKV